MIGRNAKGLSTMKKILLSILCFGFLLVHTVVIYAQVKVYEGPEDGAGDPFLEREGFMTGNRVQLLFKNNTELGDYPRRDAAWWPRGVGGNTMHNGMALLVGAAVYITQDSIPVTDPILIEQLSLQGEIDTLFYCQTSYREEMDRDLTGQIEWGFHPVAGFMNNLSETPALSNDPLSWPPHGWLYSGRQTHWSGEWDGRFGRGQIKADLEAYIVANDAQDLEYLGEDDKIKYYPRKSVKIGDIDPGVTVQKGKPWGGLGIRVKQRGFQWNNPMAQDCIFWEYTIANVSDYDLPHMAFGYWLDNDIGGENTGEDGHFDKIRNLSYFWDTDGIGTNGYRTGTAGYAYLESPGIFNDNIDNDDDGLIDEKRYNSAGEFVDKMDGIADLEKFLSFYDKKVEDLKDHWEGDEDQDWNDGIDENNDGIYQPGEFAGDDVGLDGVAPSEMNYTGPDDDGTECNHKPDIYAGYAEPNFGWTDVTETDMLGLTTLLFYDCPPHAPPYTGWFRNDESVYKRMVLHDSLTSGALNIDNLFQLFSTATFPLYKNHTEFIAMAELHSYDDIAGLNSTGHSAPALYTLKRVVQLIYEKDYRFAQPPEMPTLTAVAGDGFVQLMWNNRSDRFTRESFLAGENDFEGYKVYRSTEPDMLDPQIITDGYGTKTFSKPIFQCDIKDEYSGFATWGPLNGASYYLGDNTGIAYSFRDETVENGRTYYYALVAYDYGITPEQLQGTSIIAQDENFGISPSENNAVVRKNEFESVIFIGQNVAIVTPGTNAAGENIEVDFEVNDTGAMGNGQVVPKVVDLNSLKDGHVYKIEFSYNQLDSAYRYHAGYGYKYTSNGIQVYDMTEDDKLVLEDIMISDGYIQTPKNMNSVIEKSESGLYHITTSELMWTEIFDGLRLGIKMQVPLAELDVGNTGWMPGESPMNILYIADEMQYYRWDYNIYFSDQPLYETQLTYRYAYLDDETGTRIDRDSLLFGKTFNFRIECLNFADTSGTPRVMDMLPQDMNGNGQFDLFEDRILVGPLNERRIWDGVLFIIDFHQCQDENELPQPNDVYAIRHFKPWYKTDSLTFTVSADKLIDAKEAKTKMADIRVVPNPYVATNMMEPSVVNKYLNQSRRLLFTNLPAQSTIKIFTISGMLVRELHAPEDGLTSYNGLGDSNTGDLHWDMISWEGLEIAAGMYFYHVKDDMTGEEKTGKFAVIK